MLGSLGQWLCRSLYSKFPYFIIINLGVGDDPYGGLSSARASMVETRRLLEASSALYEYVC